MTTLESFVSTVTIAAVIGGFLDFYIGKKGQKAIRDRLETTWIEMSYMTVSDLVRLESRLAAHALSTIFGPRMFSIRKTLAVSIMFFVMLGVALTLAAFRSGSISPADYVGPYFGVPLVKYLTFLVSISISLQISLFVAKRVANTTFKSTWQGAASAAALLLTQMLILLSPYAMLATSIGGWGTSLHKYLKLALAKLYPFHYDSAVPSIVNYGVDLLLQPMNVAWGMALAAIKPTHAWHELPNCAYLGQVHITPFVFWSSGLALDCTEFALNLLRLLIFSAFALTFFLFPLRNFFSTVWLRIVESDKPVFTLTFASATALGKTLQELAKIF